MLGARGQASPIKQSAPPSAWNTGTRLWLPPRGPTCIVDVSDVCSFCLIAIRGSGEAHVDGHTYMHTRKCSKTGQLKAFKTLSIILWQSTAHPHHHPSPEGKNISFVQQFSRHFWSILPQANCSLPGPWGVLHGGERQTLR